MCSPLVVVARRIGLDQTASAAVRASVTRVARFGMRPGNPRILEPVIDGFFLRCGASVAG
jgi:hypothetical protein